MLFFSVVDLALLELHHIFKKCSTFTACYNFYIHSSIATIFGTNVAEKVSALPGETGNPEIASFHLNAACFFTNKNTRHSLKISPGQC